ncbi:hypothetical protein PPS11_39328 [Pseudomonas putida S11]|nr:hypothetical protein PPS11_39328 [Pseudomonas putida S11]
MIRPGSDMISASGAISITGARSLRKVLSVGIVRGNVDHHVEAFAQGMRLLDAQGQVGMVELVVAHPQAVAWLAGVDRVGASRRRRSAVVLEGRRAGASRFGLGG